MSQTFFLFDSFPRRAVGKKSIGSHRSFGTDSVSVNATFHYSLFSPAQQALSPQTWGKERGGKAMIVIRRMARVVVLFSVRVNLPCLGMIFSVQILFLQSLNSFFACFFEWTITKGKNCPYVVLQRLFPKAQSGYRRCRQQTGLGNREIFSTSKIEPLSGLIHLQ
uniref:Uncharacterized protein n=1 Tax=Candidatus Kentrum sp. MB TaxID=2138164 RepID=A0A450XHA1_9GAMM|nr:MAG: hypothetical protein BECKMB1821G_GA0114241_104034 [Candidatus Kentron sp. MB]VFK32276.1 MAG: hypothetical protein BECKMB1821I_GA0114274_103133 [Candidatus Kentron sp. MB]VFK75785.1 MAG: hypothetical protein BECKMB1821H_GA0114242_103134 [Candidatus Kentron sp. MB]